MAKESALLLNILLRSHLKRLWATGAISILNPKALQLAVFFYIGKNFCIRGGEEQRRLGPSQFIRSSDPDCYTYVEHGSKNRSG